jgi:hypothetical protein
VLRASTAIPRLDDIDLSEHAVEQYAPAIAQRQCCTSIVAARLDARLALTVVRTLGRPARRYGVCVSFHAGCYHARCDRLASREL